jgi:hypothetical protein
MGKASVQIRKHIDEERERLDMNIAKLESDFGVARNVVTYTWKSPLALAGLVIGILVVIVNEVSSRRRGKTRQTHETEACDIAA